MIDYVVDLAQLINALGNHPLTLIGHSLGGGIVLQYTGVFPEHRQAGGVDRGARAAARHDQGTRPPASACRHWVGEMQTLAQRKVREYASIEEALARMREENPHLSVEQARHLTIWGVQRNENGT